MKKPTILRKRFMPFETVDISGDEMLFRNEDMIITKWKAIKPRKDLSNGISCAFLKEGFKVSRFYSADNTFLYWYCDIVDVEYDEAKDEYTLVDLLVDLKICPDGIPVVLDMDELAHALETGLVTQEQSCSALRKLDKLLKMVYNGEFPPDIFKNQQYL